jgi:putative ABC transport system permease protein
MQSGPGGTELCVNGKCKSLDGTTADILTSAYAGIGASKVAEVARLRGVAAAAGGITIQDVSLTFQKDGGFTPEASGATVDGVDTGHTSLGPLSAASLTSGRSFTAAESDSAVAVVDSGYARSKGLKVGSTLTVEQVAYTVIGIASQPKGSNPPDVYIPLERAQAMALEGGGLTGEVNEIYLTAASAADVAAVGREVSALLPGATVTTASSLASQVTGSISSAATLANDLGRWLSALVLIAAFVLAGLLTMAVVSRRTAEFGTLKAIAGPWSARQGPAPAGARSGWQPGQAAAACRPGRS